MQFIKVSGDRQLIKIFPFIVNKAFACEIYLKTIIKMCGMEIPKKEHRLHFLFNLATSKSNLLSFMMDNFTIDKDLFNYKIKRISNAFKKWRYIYEINNCDINYTFLNDLANLLDIFIFKKLNEQDL